MNPALLRYVADYLSEHAARTVAGDGNIGTAIYVLNVTSMPAGMDRFPLRLLERNVDQGGASFGIRNLSIDPVENHDKWLKTSKTRPA